MIELIPAIDLIGGRCVRLTKGDYSSRKTYDASPVDMAAMYADCGVKRIHIVDLDGAKQSAPANLKTLEQIRGKVSIEVEWGGGIGGSQALKDVFNAGADCAIIGSVAALKPDLFAEWLTEYSGRKMILGADVNNEMIAVKGWQETTTLWINDLIGKFAPYGLTQVICTDISRDGMLQGPSTGLYTKLQGLFPEMIFTVSGGISSMDDIKNLDSLKLRRVIIGKAIYENKISLEEIAEWSQNA